MRRMVGLIQRNGVFYFRRTVPEPLRAEMRAVMAGACDGLFAPGAPVSLKGSRAGREFWVSLGTRDAHEARARARHLDGEADALIRLAERRRSLQSQPDVTELDEDTIQRLVAAFRHRTLAEDEARLRGTTPMTSAQLEELGRWITDREAELRDANARGDYTAAHFGYAATITVVDAGLNIALRSEADRRLHMAFIEAELDVLTTIKERQNGATRPTPTFTHHDSSQTVAVRASPAPRQKGFQAVSPKEILDGWNTDRRPRQKTFETFEKKLDRWLYFLAGRGATFHTANLGDAADWKLALLTPPNPKSPKSVSNDIYVVKTIYNWAVANGRCIDNPFAKLAQPRSVDKGQSATSRRGYTDDETIRILIAARGLKGYRRWVPWLASYTGARISEICQLERTDVACSGGIRFIRLTTITVTEDEGATQTKRRTIRKQLKNISSGRSIPMHPILIDEGFLNFVSSCKSGYLFDDITPDRFGNLGGNAMKVISRWVRTKVGISDPGVAPTHSFRHRFATLCRNYGVLSEMRERMMSHSEGEISEIYGESYWVSTLNPEIAKLPVPSGLV